MSENKRFVYAMRIWLKNGYKPMTDLAFGDGGRPTGEVQTIHFDNVVEREKYVINAYTIVWDERTKPFYSFEDYMLKNTPKSLKEVKDNVGE